MRKPLSNLLLSLTLCLPTAWAQAQGYTWQNLTPDNAAQMIRRFESNPNLAITLLKPAITPQQFSLSWPQKYSITVGDIEYTIDLRTRDFFLFFDKSFWNTEKFYGQPYNTNVLGPQAMSQADAENIARNYMQAHYPDPDWLNKMEVNLHYGGQSKLTDAEFIEYYTFTFYQDINGVRGPGECKVEVDTIFGKILWFSAIHYPVLISTAPHLTPEQAYACLFNTLQVNGGPSGEPKLRVGYPDALGNQRLVYRLEYFVGEGHYTAVVDANNGTALATMISHGGSPQPTKITTHDITSWRTRLAERPTVQKTVLKPMMGGMEAKLDFPPLLVNNQPYIYVGYLCYGAKDVKLTYKGRDHIAVASPQRSLRFSLQSTAYTCNGQTKQLSAKPVLVDDRCYVPLEAAQGVLPFAVAYDAAAKQVHFDPLPAPNKTVAVAPAANTTPASTAR